MIAEINWYRAFYWITRADDVKQSLNVFSNWLLTIGVISTIAYVLLFIASQGGMDVTSDSVKKSCAYWRKSIGKLSFTTLILMIITWVSWAAIPTKKECLLIAAGGGTLNYLTNDSIGKQIPPELGTFILSELKSISKEAKVELGISSTKEKILDEVKTMSPQQIIDKMKLDSNFAKIVLDK